MRARKGFTWKREHTPPGWGRRAPPARPSRSTGKDQPGEGSWWVRRFCQGKYLDFQYFSSLYDSIILWYLSWDNHFTPGRTFKALANINLYGSRHHDHDHYYPRMNIRPLSEEPRRRCRELETSGTRCVGIPEPLWYRSCWWFNIVLVMLVVVIVFGRGDESWSWSWGRWLFWRWQRIGFMVWSWWSPMGILMSGCFDPSW